MSPALRDAFIKLIVQKVLSGLVLKLPFLASGLPQWIAAKLLYKIVLYGFVETQLLIIDLEKIADRKDFDKKVDEHEKAKESKNEEDIKKSEAALIDSFRDLVKFN